ncbi:GNAT family N-acetyltransferase [Pseudochelatococcus sp. G4_1912]|jgi:RimJ/RimL family protein N-acetyltransferase|uniref:GNAT family N-acetyltransferase n=1 Tax=Pseudochelatococcus sp. G4_1912 TaxID=3114288 RepID=UPI0039C6E53F
MKPYVRGKSIYFREVNLDDAEFIVEMRTNPDKNKYLSHTSVEVESQVNYLRNYLKSTTDFYFIICNYEGKAIGTIRIYDIRDNSFCWGSWILSKDAPKSAAVESALLIYDFAFFSLHYPKAHFDVRKNNERVVEFHKRFGARIVDENELDYFFEYDRDAYSAIRSKYLRFLPD